MRLCFVPAYAFFRKLRRTITIKKYVQLFTFHYLNHLKVKDLWMPGSNSCETPWFACPTHKCRSLLILRLDTQFHLEILGVSPAASISTDSVMSEYTIRTRNNILKIQCSRHWWWRWHLLDLLILPSASLLISVPVYLYHNLVIFNGQIFPISTRFSKMCICNTDLSMPTLMSSNFSPQHPEAEQLKSATLVTE